MYFLNVRNPGNIYEMFTKQNLKTPWVPLRRALRKHSSRSWLLILLRVSFPSCLFEENDIFIKHLHLTPRKGKVWEKAAEIFKLVNPKPV